MTFHLIIFKSKFYARCFQVLGHKEGLNVMEQADPLFLLLGLPTIPFGLFVAKLLRWEEAVLRVWRKHSSKLPFFGSLYQGNSL